MKRLSPRTHGYIDYVFVILLMLAPLPFRLSGTSALLCYLIAGTHLVVSLLTDYPLAISKRIPFHVHGAIEFSLGVGLFAAPWLFGFSHASIARNFFVISGLALIVVFLTTNYGTKVVPSATPYDRYGP
jgi:hypothetical protein